MTHIFYMLLFVFILYEIFVFANAEIIINKKKEYKNTPEYDRLEYLSGNFNLVLYSAFNILYLLYVFVGLFSSQWSLFLLFLGMSFIPKDTVTKRKADAVISIMVLLFILLNKYHLHINLF